jgi:acetylglutamate kinase
MTDGNLPIVVLKIGGNQVEDEEFLAGFVSAVKSLLASHRVVIVHGGGKEIADLHERFGEPFTKVQGLRVTSVLGMQLVEMALNGSVNTRLVRWLVGADVPALGLSGIDLGLIQVEPMLVDGQSLGRVGAVQKVNEGPLQALLALGFVPVVSPVSLGADGQSYNVNADHAATALARALRATKLIFVTNVPGVQVAGRTVRALVATQAEELIRDGIVSGGMIPKVRAALEAANAGVYQAVITDLAGLAAEGGTAIVHE